jgi:hypothetical protein
MGEPKDQTQEEPQQDEETEVDEKDAELLPDREAMSVIHIGDSGGLSPPAP